MSALFKKRLAEIAEEEKERIRWKPWIISLVAAAVIAWLASTAWFAFGSPAHAGVGAGSWGSGGGDTGGNTAGHSRGGGCTCPGDGGHGSWTNNPGPPPLNTRDKSQKINPNNKQSGAHGNQGHPRSGKGGSGADADK